MNSPRPSTAEQHQAYREGRCVDCRTAPYSAGRPRCGTCHSAVFTTIAPPAPTGSNSWADLTFLERLAAQDRGAL